VSVVVCIVQCQLLDKIKSSTPIVPPGYLLRDVPGQHNHRLLHSSKCPGERRSHSNQPHQPSSDIQRTSAAVGDVPTAVKSLLLATKQLQEALYQWSIGQVSETDVSDVYVRIGTDFNHALHAFAYYSIDMRWVGIDRNI
jgi:hypothetical protein